eukprot:283798-Hanusia_phi.AAC.1
MVRERKSTQRYKPENFKAQTKAKTPQRRTANAVDNDQPIPAIQIPQTRIRVAQDNQLQKTNSIDKKYRNPSYYRDFTKFNDQTATDYKHLLNTFKIETYTDDSLNKTVNQYMTAMQKSIDPAINGPNSWTNQLYDFDYNPQQYNNLEYIIKPTLDDIKNNAFVSSDKQDDKDTHSKLKNIIQLSVKHQKWSTYWGDLKALTRLAKICLGDKHELYHKLSILSTDFNKAVLQRSDTQNRLRKNEEGFQGNI